MGFFKVYYYLKEDYLIIKNIINPLMHEDTISNACLIINKVDELITKYKLTQ